MKKDWEIKKLGDICEFRRGLTYSKNDEVENSSNAVLRSNNIDLITNRLDLSEIKYISDKIKIDETKKVKQDSLLICTANGSKAHLGKVALIDDDYDFAFGGFMGLLIPNENIYPSFFYYALISDNYKKFIKSLSDGANINNLKFQDLSKFEIPVPPLEEQKRIVKILDEKFAQLETIKANAQTNLQSANDLFQSQLTKAFSNTTWEKKRLGEVSSQLFAGGDAPKENYSKEKTEKYNIPIYANAVAENGLYGYTDVATVFEPSVTIAARGSGTGYVISRNEPFLPIVRLIVVVPNVQIITQRYLYFTLRNIPIDHSGAAIPQLTIPMIRDYEIPLPPLPEQKRIVKELDTLNEKVRQLQEIYTKQIANCAELKQSLLQKAFEGEL